VHNTVIPTFNSALQQSDILLTSFTKDGQLRWSKVMGGDLEDLGLNLKIDLNDNVVVSGRVFASGNLNEPPVHFDTDTILPVPIGFNQHRKSMFLVKYDSLGQFQWLRMPEPDTVSLGIAFSSMGFGLDIDPMGNIHWLTFLRPGLHTWQGHNALIAQEGYYILKYRPNGTVYNVVQVPIQSNWQFFFDGIKLRQKLVYDHLHHRYLLGGTLGILGNDSVWMFLGNDTIRERAYLISLDTLGQPQWHVTGVANPALGSGRGLTLHDVKLDPTGNIYVCGGAGGNFNFNGTTVTFTGGASSPYIFKLNANGQNIWGKIANVNGSSEANEIAIFGQEVGITGTAGNLNWQGPNDKDIYTLPPGHQGSNAFLSVFNQTTGDLKLTESVSSGPMGYAWGHSLSSDSEGAYYLSGSFDFELRAGPDTLFKIGGQRSFFLTKFVCAPPQVDFAVSYPNVSSAFFAFTGNRADSLHWDFGNGQSAHGDSVSHTFPATGQWYQVCLTAFTKCGQTTFCDSVLSDALSLPNAPNAAKFDVFPNPARQNFVITYETATAGVVVGQVYNVQGVALHQWQGQSNVAHEVQTESWPNGVYVITLQTPDGKVLYKRVVVQH
jgi:hypothetical protein